MLKEAGLGKKDMGQSVFSVWEDLFSAPNARLKNSINKEDFGKRQMTLIVIRKLTSKSH